MDAPSEDRRGRLPHDPEALAALRAATPEDPLRVLLSGCLAGWACGVDGTDYGLGTALGGLMELPNLRAIPFCPEDHGLGTPRTMPDIHGGDGYDVLDGRARVLDPEGNDLTGAMISGARAMAALARGERAEIAILTDMSAACGTQVISDGCRDVEQRRFHASVGIAAALLLRDGVPVVSQRDFRTLAAVRARLDPDFRPDPQARDHHETDWYRATFELAGGADATR